MPVSTYTDVFARFSDQAAAETLAEYISDVAGFPCDLVELSDLPLGFGNCYGIRIAQELIADLKATLKLTPIAKYADPVSPNVVAGRLAREGIPCYIGGPPVTGVGPYGIGYSGVPVDEDGTLCLGTLAVPARCVDAAKQVLKDELSEAELARLALNGDSGSRDPP